jgi:glycosyltransferase involved in cell wall biosynthesis
VIPDVAEQGRCGPPEAYPPQLLNDYLAIARTCSPRTEGLLALRITASRTASLSARRLLAHAATGAASLEQLLAAARGGVRARQKLQGSRMHPGALVDLARVMAWQDILPDDTSDALALLDLALECFGPDSIPENHQGFHARLAYHLGDAARASTLLEIYPHVPDAIRSILKLDLTNPFINVDGGETAEWLRRFEDLLPPCHLMLSANNDRAPFDRLTATADRLGAEGPTVTVVVTSFRPSHGLQTAIRSLINQSWVNVEILVVDDGSGPEYDPFLRACGGLDERVSVIKLDYNVGTYCARNVGFDAASGEFITFLDSDDWAHPTRLEQQLRPLLADPSRLATIGHALKANDDLRLSLFPRSPRTTYAPSLLFRRDPVLNRVGYLDGIRKSADNEYVARINAAFGAGTVHNLGSVLGLYRLIPDSLSSNDFRGRWVHPARFAYRSAYRLWHRQIEAGEAEPYMARSPTRRPFAAPGYLRNREGDSAEAESCDVVFAGDWRRCEGSQRAVVEEIEALRERGLRIGVVHMESFRFMTPEWEPLSASIQGLVNKGKIAHCLPTERRRVSLLIIRDPLCLQFAAGRPSRLEVERVSVVANQAPRDRDGQDLRYVPRACTAAVEQLFSVRPLWLPQGPQARQSLQETGVGGLELSERDMRPVIDPEVWCLERIGFRAALPIVGFHYDAERAKWPKRRDALLQVYPDSPEIDVRIMGGRESARALLGSTALPSNWMAYEHDEVSIRSFLFQIDFWAYFPHPAWTEGSDQAIVEALAAGCVVILPHQFRDIFGDAAVYRRPSEVQETISSYHSNPELFAGQSMLAQQRVRTMFGQKQYSDLISTLLPSSSTSEAETTGVGRTNERAQDGMQAKPVR